MKFEKEIAEICGIHVGDGYLRNDGKRVELDISGSIEEKPYYDEHVIPLLSKTFGIDVKGKVFHSRNTYGFVIRDNNIVKKFHEVGFPYGKKGFSVKIPNFILESNNLEVKMNFLRGLLDTDGCISFSKRGKGYALFKRKYHTYPKISLKTISKELSDGLNTLLKQLDIQFWIQKYESKNKNEHKQYIIWVNGKNVEKWMEIIGSKNPVKYSRYEVWKRYGFCPSHTSLSDRIRILKKGINPKSFYGPVT